jgi:hypothetical protein
MSITPSPRLIKTREALQREVNSAQAGRGGRPDYGPVAQWLVSQLAGADPGQLGWGIIAVTGHLLPPDPLLSPPRPGEKPGTRAGQRRTFLRASQVGEALLSSAQIAAERPAAASFEVGNKLADLDMSEVYIEFTGLPSSHSPNKNAAQLRREFVQRMSGELRDIRQLLVDDLPGADHAAIGWALIGTGISLLLQAGKAPKPSGWRRSKRQREETAQGSAMNSAMLLACVGDYLTNPAA